MITAELFEARFIPEPMSGCFIWTGRLHRLGYGEFCVDGANEYAHRVSYELYRGPIPAGKSIDHLCRNRSCVNPRHMEAVDHRTNVLRGSGVTAINARKTACDRGHDLSGENLYINVASGSRVCRKCRKVSQDKYRNRARLEKALALVTDS